MTTRTLLAILAVSLPVLAEDPQPPAPDKDDAKQAVLDAIAKTKEKNHKFTAQTDIEAGGSPMMSSETKGTYAKPYSFISMDMMGRQIETWSDGSATVAKDWRTGEWARREGAGGQRGLTLDMLTGAIKSASWDDEEKKVGSHVCRVAKLQVDKEKLAGIGLGGRRGGGGGGQGGGNAVNKASIRVYVDKDDGKLRRLKATLAVSANFQGQAMDLDIVLDTRYTYSSKYALEVPAEVKELFEQKPVEKKAEEPGTEEPKKDEGSGK